ncbi:MAG: serine/threonine protein kinase [Planctomycetes bacterium]|nr:serine/threonine protein kinase [Planctomycetota bacterium]
MKSKNAMSDLGDPVDTLREEYRIRVLQHLVEQKSARSTPNRHDLEALFPEVAKEFPDVLAEALALSQEASDLPQLFDLPHSRLGDYQLEELVGQGGQGRVYRARDTCLDRTVAVKVLCHPAFFSSAAQGRLLRARFEREAKITSRLHHPGICQVYAFAQAGGVPFIAMQYIDGTSLNDWVRQTPGEERVGGWRTTVNRIIQAARALHAAHEASVVHRDIKPSNLMVDANGNCVVLDFGIARGGIDADSALSQSGDVVGTLYYMSPQQIQGETVDRRTDVWALGATLYECLTGRRPFDGSTAEACRVAILEQDPAPLRESTPDLPSDLAVVVDKALEKDPSRRYASALVLAEELQRVLEGEPVLAKPATTWTRVRRWSRRNRAVVRGAIVVFALMITATVSLTAGLIEARAQAETNRLLLERNTELLEAERTASRALALQVVENSQLKTKLTGARSSLEGQERSLESFTHTLGEPAGEGDVLSEPVRKYLLEALSISYLQNGMPQLALPLAMRLLDDCESHHRFVHQLLWMHDWAAADSALSDTLAIVVECLIAMGQYDEALKFATKGSDLPPHATIASTTSASADREAWSTTIAAIQQKTQLEAAAAAAGAAGLSGAVGR